MEGTDLTTELWRPPINIIMLLKLRNLSILLAVTIEPTAVNWFFLKKIGQSRPLFVYFCHFLDTISIIQIEKSVDGVLGIRTWGRRMVGADETTEL